MKSYTFDNSWEQVVRGFWRKYPSQLFKFVKWNRTVAISIEGDILKVKRVMLNSVFLMGWFYVLEQIELDRNLKILKMDSRIIKKAKIIPSSICSQHIIYKARDEFNRSTDYFKKLTGDSFQTYIQKLKLGSAFEDGCKLVEQRIKQFVEDPTSFVRIQLSLIK